MGSWGGEGEAGEGRVKAELNLWKIFKSDQTSDPLSRLV